MAYILYGEIQDIYLKLYDREEKNEEYSVDVFLDIVNILLKTGVSLMTYIDVRNYIQEVGLVDCPEEREDIRQSLVYINEHFKIEENLMHLVGTDTYRLLGFKVTITKKQKKDLEKTSVVNMS